MEDLLVKHRTVIDKASKILREPLEIESSIILRQQMQRTVAAIPDIAVLKSKAEQYYRLYQKECALTKLPADQKGKGREYIVNGDAADFRYQRDVLQDLFDGLKNKVGTQRTTLNSLRSESYGSEND